MNPLTPDIPERPRTSTSSVESRRRGSSILFLTLFLFPPALTSFADTVAIQKPGDASALVYSDVKITNIRNGIISFTTASGNNVQKELATVSAMTIDDEPQFNQAQTDFASNHVDRAVDEFDQTIQQTSRPWLKAYCMPLLTDAANKSGRFDKAVEGFIALVLTQPPNAASHRPTVPTPDSGYLDNAAQALSDASNTANLTNDQQAAILSLLLEVDRARKDAQAVDSVASRLTQLTGVSATNQYDATLALADAKITEAAAAIAAKKYDQAAALINGSRNIFTDSQHQSHALYILAQALDGQAQSADDPDAWRDAAIAYMRVVAFFKDTPGAPHVAASLLATGAILETHLDQASKALSLYQNIVSKYPDSPVASEAADRVARLKAAGVQAD